MEIPFPPTHPDGHRAQVALCRSIEGSQGCLHPVDWHVGQGTPAPDCDCCSWRKNEPAAPAPVRTLPPTGIAPEKWVTMPRRERRALMRGRKR